MENEITSYKVVFQWQDTDTYCANICKASSREQVRSHYKGHRIIDIHPANTSEIEEAVRKKMPIIMVNAS